MKEDRGVNCFGDKFTWFPPRQNPVKRARVDQVEAMELSVECPVNDTVSELIHAVGKLAVRETEEWRLANAELMDALQAACEKLGLWSPVKKSIVG